MTYDIEKTPAGERAKGQSPPAEQRGQAAEGREPQWWRRPWIIPLVLVSVIWWQYIVRPFLDFNEETAPIPPHEDYSLYYPTLLGHIGFGTIAMITVVLQVWPRVRLNHRRLHRFSGRIYVVSTLISGLLALSIVRFAPPVGQIGVSLATILWMGLTTMGFIRARQRRFAEHRRFMLYSFAIVMNNTVGTFIVYVGLRLPDPIEVNYLLEAARWVGWVFNLILVQAWLNHTAKRPLLLPR
ncbi:DUF2306 domain-containing protein [Actinomadura alba]|uniref:DUF2306 domain-containing protein n=1 Tax=Actinomadura alba TaxID=406431 RepID=A0ABR7LRT0_9ACTN|nr:DUF2306 domain-containing protein [Actinomadura alba]MBC6467537.1 DUF2306 domain-containing protein [Actinomadura alba]